MRAFVYSAREAAASLLRGWRAACLAVLTIAAGLLVLGFFVTLNANMQRLAARWAESAEFSVFLRDDVTPAQLESIGALITGSGVAAGHQYVTKEQAAARFAQDFAELAPAAGRLSRNPFPASIDVRLRPELREVEDAVENLARMLASQAGVSDVRYDRRWLSRLNHVIGFVRSIGIAIVTLLALAAALTVANVVRLAAYARQDEIEIMQLVGAPLTYVRGPLVLEGMLQGGAGALLALAFLAALSAVGAGRYSSALTELLGAGSVSLLSPALAVVLLLGGMLLGSVGGLVAARGVR